MLFARKTVNSTGPNANGGGRKSCSNGNGNRPTVREVFLAKHAGDGARADAAADALTATIVAQLSNPAAVAEPEDIKKYDSFESALRAMRESLTFNDLDLLDFFSEEMAEMTGSGAASLEDIRLLSVSPLDFPWQEIAALNETLKFMEFEVGDGNQIVETAKAQQKTLTLPNQGLGTFKPLEAPYSQTAKGIEEFFAALTHEA